MTTQQVQPNPFESTFKSNWRQTAPPSCKVSPKIIKKLCDTLNDSCKEVADKEVSKLQQGAMSVAEFQQLSDAVRNSFKIHIEIVGSKGEYFASTQTSILDDDHLPSEVDRITLDSSFNYRTFFKNDPMDSVRIVFDFRKPPLFDFVSNPSLSTRNDSFITVTGQSNSWVTGVYESILGTVKQHSTRRTWLHKQSIYDLFLWLFVLPLAFWNLSKLLSAYPSLINGTSNVLIVFGHIYFFIVCLFLFRAFFNYGRWLFPYVELETPLQSISTKHRIFFLTLTSALVIGLLRDFALSIIKAIF